MASLVPKAVALVRHGRAYELIGSLLAAWGTIARADSPAEVLAALDGGAELLLAEEEPWRQLELAHCARLRPLLASGGLRVLLLAERAGAAPPQGGACVPVGAPLQEVLQALQMLVLAPTFQAPRSCEATAELLLLTGPVRGTLLETRGTLATMSCRALVPPGAKGTLQLQASGAALAIPCACSAVERATDGHRVALELGLEGSYRLWSALRPANEAPTAPARVLVVDDSELLNRITQAVLGRAGFEVRCITNPFELRQQALAFRPALVLVDYNIPLLTGDKVIDLGKQVGLEVPMAIYSGAPEDVLAAAAARCGAVGYIPKRLPPDQLVARVRALLPR